MHGVKWVTEEVTKGRPPQGCSRGEGTPEAAPEAVTGGWRRLPKRLGAVTVGYKCH